MPPNATPPLPESDLDLLTVYRYYRADDKPLHYVGKTVNPGRRGPKLGVVPSAAAGRSTIGNTILASRSGSGPSILRRLTRGFSYELVERFVRYKPSLRGPVPLLYSERLAAGRDVQPDIYPEETRVGADYNRYIPDRAGDVNAGGVWILVGLVAVTLILVTVLVTAFGVVRFRALDVVVAMARSTQWTSRRNDATRACRCGLRQA